MKTKANKQRWFWLAICTPFIICGAIVLGAFLLPPAVRAYDAYDYYPGAACNGVYGDPSTGVGTLPVGQSTGQDFACPIIRIYPRDKTKLDFVVFEMDVKSTGLVRVCARRDDTKPICALKQVIKPGRQEITIKAADLANIRNSGAYHWDYYLYAVVRLYPGDKFHGYKVYWNGL